MDSSRLLSVVLLCAAGGGPAGLFAEALDLYPHPNDPFANPLQQQAWVKPPRALSPNKPHWSAYRGSLSPDALDAYDESGLGDVVWPQWPVLADKNKSTLTAQLQDVKRRGLWLTDISNYVPGDPSDCDPAADGISGVCEYHLPRSVADDLNDTMGERFTGMDNGEQDGRYLSYTAEQQVPLGGGPMARPSELRHGYLQFAKFFDRMADDLGNKLMALNSLWDTHYFAKSGFYTMLGAETAQGLPNAQLFYSFLRGAAKQFGTWIWGNASIYNRFGFKTCANQTVDGESMVVCSEAGTSLSLFRRLMYTQVMYGAKIFGFETLSSPCPMPDVCGPISEIHKAGMDFATKTELGTHVTTVAVVADFLSGFAPPRNLYAQVAYRVWGSIPFASGDFWFSNLLDLFYPGYTGASYFHNETGFSTATPYADVVDVLLSDCAADILARYPIVLLATPIISAKAETTNKLEAYVKAGGHLVLNADALASLPLFGMELDDSSSDCKTIPAGSQVTVKLTAGKIPTQTHVKETRTVRVCPVTGTEDAKVVASAGATPLAYFVNAGKGTVLALATTGMAAEPVVTALRSPTTPDTELPNPYPMVDHAHALLDDLLSSQTPFTAGDGLTVVVNRVESTKYLVAVSNPALREMPYKLVSNVGAVASIEEIQLQDRQLGPTLMSKNLTGYTPPGQHSLGMSTSSTIAGLDQRIFSVTLSAESANLLPSVPPATSPDKIALPLPHTSDLTEAVMLRSTFKQHFDAIVLDWTYVERRTASELQKEGRWAFMRNISLVVDFTSGLNLYPDLRLCNNSVQYTQSVDRISAVLRKMSTPVNASTHTMDVAFAADAIIAMHREPENGRGYYHNNNTEPVGACANDTLRAFQSIAAEFPNITLHLRVGAAGRQPSGLVAGVATLDLLGHPPNIMLAPHLAVMSPTEPMLHIQPVGMLFVAGAAADEWNGLKLQNAPLATLGSQALETIGGHISTAYTTNAAKYLAQPWLVVDASMPTYALEATEDAEYGEVAAIESMLANHTS